MKLPTLLYRNPFQLAVAVILLLSGARALVDHNALPTAIDHLPELFGITYRVLLALSGVLILAGMLVKAGWGPALEQAGLWIAGTVFVVYGIAAVLTGIQPAATFFGVTLFAIAAACGLRARAISKDQRAVGYVIREAKRQGEPHE